jgi:ribose transport system substrate-binding protein
MSMHGTQTECQPLTHSGINTVQEEETVVQQHEQIGWVPRHRLSRGRLGAVALTVAAGLAIAGCGSSKSSSGGSSSGTSTAASSGASTTSASDASGGSSAVSAALTKFESATSKYQLPSAALKNAGSLKGKTIFYIPVASVVPEFGITAAELKTAAAAVGAKVDVCSDPTGTPTQWNACVGQAISQKVAAIVLDAAPWQVVANQLTAATKKGIKVVTVDQPADPALPKADSADILGVSGTMQTAVADWVINDSKGKGSALILMDTDGPAPPIYISKFALPQFKKYAPRFKYTIQKISTANQGQVASAVSSQLLKNPSTGYVYTEFDQFLPNAQQGVQSANATSKVKGVSSTALLAGLQLLKSKSYSYADAGQDYPFSAWAFADEAYRLILGQPAVAEDIPMRLFTRQNVSSVTLSNAAQDSGAWYGPTNFPTLFKKLWGVG